MNANSSAPKERWIATAQRLRAARRACDRFLDQWIDGVITGQVRGVDRVAADVDAALADPLNHDWSILYRGSVLDD